MKKTSISYFLLNILLIYMPYNNSGGIINESDLLKIHVLLKNNYDNFQKTISDKYDLGLLNKTKSVLNVILGKTECGRYRENNDSLWKIRELPFFNLSEEEDPDRFFYSLFGCFEKEKDKKCQSQINFLDKKIKEINVKEWIESEKILDGAKAKEILNDNDISRENNQISFLYDALYNDKKFELKSFMDKIEDPEIKNAFFLIYFQCIPALCQLLCSNKGKDFKVIGHLRDISKNILDMFWDIDLENIQDQSLLKALYKEYQEKINQNHNNNIIPIYNSIFSNIFDMNVNFFHLSYVKSLVTFQLYQGIFAKENNTVKIIALYQIVNTFIGLFEKKSFAFQQENIEKEHEFLFFNESEQERFVKGYLSGQIENNGLQDVYVFGKCFDYLKDTKQFSFLLDVNMLKNNEKGVAKALCDCFNAEYEEKASIYKIKDFVYKSISAVKKDKRLKELFLYYIKQFEVGNSDLLPAVLNNMKDSVRLFYGLRNVDEKSLSEMIDLVFEFDLEVDPGLDKLTFNDERLREHFSLEYQIIFCFDFWIKYNPESWAADFNKLRESLEEFLFEKIIKNMSLEQGRKFDEAKFNEFFVRSKKLYELKFADNIDSFYDIDITEIKNIFLYFLLKRDLKNINNVSDSCWSYFRLDQEIIKNICNMLSDNQKRPFLYSVIAFLENKINIDKKDLLNIIFLLDNFDDVNAYIEKIQWNEQELDSLSILYINKVRKEYIRKKNFNNISDFNNIPDKITINNEKFFLDYLCQNFDFITTNFQDIILKSINQIQSLKDNDLKIIATKICKDVFENGGVEKYKTSYSISKEIEQQDAAYNNLIPEFVIPHPLLNNRLNESDRRIAKEKKIIEYLIYNFINVLAHYRESNKKNIFTFLLDLTKTASNTIDYYKYFSVFFAEDKALLFSEGNMKEIIALFQEQKEKEDYISLFLSLHINKKEYERLDFNTIVMEALCVENHYQIIDNLFKNDLYITLDWFLTYYKYYDKKNSMISYGRCLARVESLWERLKNKGSNMRDQEKTLCRKIIFTNCLYININEEKIIDYLSFLEQEDFKLIIDNKIVKFLNLLKGSCSDFILEDTKINNIFDLLNNEEKQIFLCAIITKLIQLIKNNQHQDKIDQYKKQLSKRIVLLDNVNDINDYIKKIEWSEEELDSLSILYINKVRQEYIRKIIHFNNISDFNNIPDKIKINNKTVLLDYYCQNFDFITNNIKKIIINSIDRVKETDDNDFKIVIADIWKEIFKHTDGQKYDKSYRVVKEIAKQEYDYNNSIPQSVDLGSSSNNRSNEDDRRIAKEKKIIEHVIYNFINVLAYYAKSNEKNILTFLLDLMKTNSKIRDYYKYFSVFFAEDKDLLNSARNMEVILCQFKGETEQEDYISLFLSLHINKEEYERLDFNTIVMKALCARNHYQIIDSLFKNDLYITLDWFLTHYNYEEDNIKKDIVCLARVESLWERLKNKGSNMRDQEKKLCLEIIWTNCLYININEEKIIDYLSFLEQKDFKSAIDSKKIVIFLNLLKGHSPDFILEDTKINNIFDSLNQQEKQIFLCAIIRKPIQLIKNNQHRDKIDQYKKYLLNRIFLLKNLVSMKIFIEAIEWSEEELASLFIFYINRMKKEYINNKEKALVFKYIPRNIIIKNEKILLDYYSQNFDFITKAFKDIIFEYVNSIKELKELDYKDFKTIFADIWQKIFNHSDCQKYKSIDINNPNYSKMEKEKKIIQYVIYNFINVLVHYRERNENNILTLLLDLMKADFKTRDYYKCFSVFFAEDKAFLISERNMEQIIELFPEEIEKE